MLEVKVAKVKTKNKKTLWTVVLIMTTKDNGIKMMRYQGRFLNKTKARYRANLIRMKLIREFGKENVK